MMMLQTMAKLSENAKKAFLIFFLIFIIIFVLIGYISYAVQGIMKRQGTKADEMLKNVVNAEYFDSEKKLRRFGIRKNIKQFYIESRIPFLIIFFTWIAYLIFCLFGNWGYNPLSSEYGFGTLLFKFSSWPKERFFGIKLISGWPSVISKPHFETRAIFSYFFVPANIIGILWFLSYTQCYIARSFRIRKIAKSVFRKKLVPDNEPTSSQK